MKYKICIPIPIRYTIIREVKPIIDKAINTKPDLIELRFDYISHYKALSIEFIRNLMNIISPHAAVIFTFRDPAEGGQIQIKQDDRLTIYKMFIKVKPDYIDLEMNIDNKVLNEIIKLAYQNKVKIIFSSHNYERTPPFNEITSNIQNFNKDLIQEFGFDLEMLEGSIYKITFTAQTFDDNLTPLRLCKEISSSKIRIISFCMGPLGVFSRINCVFAGSFLTYAFLEERTAEGQISIQKMREIYDLILY